MTAVHQQHSWGYASHNGPHTWAKCCENAAGSKQSPININSKQAIADVQLKDEQLEVKQTYCKNSTVSNTGHGFIFATTTDAYLTGGPLGEKRYNFAQFHAHWGSSSKWGSEHTLDGQAFSGEIHFVFYNSEYSTFSEALKHPDGLAVVGRFIQDSGSEGTECQPLKYLISRLDKIEFTDSPAVPVSEPVWIHHLIPNSTSRYYTYEGSLTTPPCCECVTWIVFHDPIFFSPSQLDTCRALKISTKDEKPVGCADTYRPPCPLGTRVLRTNI